MQGVAIFQQTAANFWQKKLVFKSIKEFHFGFHIARLEKQPEIYCLYKETALQKALRNKPIYNVCI